MIDFTKEMEGLRNLKGYLGSAVLNFSGETLYIDNEKTGTDIGFSATLFNDSYRLFSEASVDVGLSEISIVEAKTFDGHIFLIKSAGNYEKNPNGKIEIFSIFRDDGNIALAKIKLEKIGDNLSKELSTI